MLGYACEEMEDAMSPTRPTATRLFEHWLDASTGCFRINKQIPNTAGGVYVHSSDLDTGAGDQDASDGTEDTMPLTHTHTHTMATLLSAETQHWRSLAIAPRRHVQVRE